MRYSAFVMLLAMLLLPVQVFAEQVRGRVVGVHDDDTLLPNGSGQAAPTRRKPTEDEILVQLNPLLGTSYSNYNDFYKNQLKAGHFLGLAIEDNIHPEIQTHLTQAEKALRDKGLSDKASDWGIYKIDGGGPESGGHRWGLAIDINYDSNPYVLHEAGEVDLDRQLRQVYNRIAWFILGKDRSDLGEMITQGISPSGFKSISDAYDRLQEESKAMVRYFQFMRDRSLLKLFVQEEWPNIPQHFVKPDVDQWISIMKQDYLILGGVLDGKRAPTIKKNDGEYADRPFSGGDATRRDPAKGFLDIPRPIVEALTISADEKNRRLKWGAIDFLGGVSGDVMHFYLEGGTFYQLLQKATANAQALIPLTSSGTNADSVRVLKIGRERHPGSQNPRKGDCKPEPSEFLKTNIGSLQ
jgi:hypothetical protein